MAVTRTFYNLFFRKNYLMLGTVFAGAWAFDLSFNRSMNNFWDWNNQGRQWKDIRHKYIESEEEPEAEE